MGKSRCVLLVLAVAMTGCVAPEATRSLAIAPKNPATLDRAYDGSAMLSSTRTDFVTVRPLRETFSGDAHALPAFSILVTNGSAKDITLRPGDVAVFSGEERVALISPEALQDRLDRTVNANVGGNSAPRGPSRSAEIVRHTPTETSTRSESGPRYMVPAHFTDTALEAQLIHPGAVGGGYVTLDPEDVRSRLPLTIVVTVSGEKHTFVFEVRD